MHLDVVTPEKNVYSQDVDMVITRAAHGDIGILPNHAPFVSPLGITVVRVKKDGKEERIAVSGGFLEVHENRVTILAETAESADQIDVNRAKEAQKRAKRRLETGEGDLIRAKIALHRAMNRLKAVNVDIN